MTGVMRRFSAALAAAAMAVSIVPFADISAYAEYAATHPEGFVYADGSKFMCDGSPYYYGGTNCYYLTYKTKSEIIAVRAAVIVRAARTAIISPIRQKVR